MNIKSILIGILLFSTSVSVLALNSETISSMDNEDPSDTQFEAPFEQSFSFIEQRIQQIFSFIKRMLNNDFVDSLFEKIMNYFSLNDQSMIISTEISQNLQPIEIWKTDHLDEDQIISKNDYINYTITITNPDTNEGQSQVHVIDELPEEVTFISSDVTSLYYDSSEHFTYIVYENVGSGVSHSFNITVQVKNDIETPKMIRNIAKVNSSDLVFNSTYEETAIGSYDFTPLTIEKDDRLSNNGIKQSTQSQPVYINYSITVTNQHPLDVHNVSIRDKLPYEVIFNRASHQATTNTINDYTYVFWGFDKLEANTSKQLFVNVSLDPVVTPGTTFTNKVFVKCNETGSNEGIAEESTSVIESNPPITDIYVGEPNYEKNENIFVTSDTPIILEAKDNETYWTGVTNLTYEIWNDEQFKLKKVIEDNDTDDEDSRDGYIKTSLFLNDTCNNTISYYAQDLFNKESEQKKVFQVINTPPTLDISIGMPKIPCFIEIDDTCYEAISPNTPITIQTSCTHSCDAYVDLEHLFIEVYQGESYGEWELINTMTIDDNDMWDEDQSNDSIKISLHLENDCWHQIHVWAEDKLGNRNPEQGHVLTKNVFVDASSPQSESWYTGPEYNTAFRWITNQTLIHVESIDLGCTDQSSGVNYTEWWLLKNKGETWEETKRERVYDNQEDDLDDSIGRILLELQIEENGEYYFYYQSTDSLGNKEPTHKHLIRVDSAPPTSSLTVDEPNCMYYEDEGSVCCVTTNTMVHINSEDEEVPFAVGIKYIDYEIYRCEELITTDRVYDVNQVMFHFEEECSHFLRYRAVDLLDTMEPWITQIFNVDDQKPTINLTVNGELVETDHDHPHYWVRTDTEIMINGYNHGSCPEWSMSYRINEGPWIDITDAEERPHTFTLPDECKYTVEIDAHDCVGNSNHLLTRFYVDDTPPDFHIIKPHNGIYANGESIHATFYAIDQPVQSPPCYENHAVGISDQSNGEAWIIDIYPEFQICTLDSTNFYYDESSFEYDGEVVIPFDCTIPDGSAYFVSGAFDRLCNGQGMIKDQIHHYYDLYGPSSNQFTQLIDQLLVENKILDIVMDNHTPEDDEPPIVSIVQPVIDEIIDSDVLHVQISGSDDETSMADLFVQVELTIPGYHQFLETAKVNWATGFFELDFDVHCLKNNTEIELRAYATDLNDNQGESKSLSCSVENEVYYAEWLDEGWNQLEFEIIEGENDIESVFRSIQDDYKLVFELDSESYFISNQIFNTLNEINPGKTYWVKMNESSGFYLD